MQACVPGSLPGAYKTKLQETEFYLFRLLQLCFHINILSLRLRPETPAAYKFS